MSRLIRYFGAVITLFLIITPFVQAGTLQRIQVDQKLDSSSINFTFSIPSKFSYFYLNNPNRLVIDFQNSQIGNNKFLPIKVNDSVVEKIRTSRPPKSSTLRIVFELSNTSKASFLTQGKNIIVKVTENGSSQRQVLSKSSSKKAVFTPTHSRVLTIAIDAGHGGKDPGTIGRILKVKEKFVALQIAKELAQMLNRDPRFRAVLTRSGDYFISVPDRSEVARKKKANYLVSIHADSNPSSNFRGASVWVLSNKRANDEMGKWLEDHEKQSQLLGGAGSVLSSHHEKYLDQTVLDLQFGHSQRVGYLLGQSVLKSIGKVASLRKTTPQHASLGVLRSPDIPSILVETGFLSNEQEEKLLSSATYRRKIANAIYQGLVDYYKSGVETVPTNVSSSNSPDYHVVKAGESLGLISIKYNIKLRELRRLNNLKNDTVYVGQKIKLK